MRWHDAVVWFASHRNRTRHSLQHQFNQSLLWATYPFRAEQRWKPVSVSLSTRKVTRSTIAGVYNGTWWLLSLQQVVFNFVRCLDVGACHSLQHCPKLFLAKLVFVSLEHHSPYFAVHTFCDIQ